MADAREQTSFKAEISADKSEATLTIAPKCANDPAAEALCQQALTERKVPWTAPVAKAVRALLQDVARAGTQQSAVVARATLPAHGTDGSVIWQVDESAEEKDPQGDESAQCVDFYEHSAYVMVEAGQVIGQVIDPTGGEDGQDLTGNVLPAKPGRQATLTLDESIIHNARGELIAQRDGVLIRRRDGKASINEVLQIKGFVDFSTGNIDFHGDVVIGQGIRDRFVVAASGHIEVHGLIEAATIRSGGDLIAHTGMASRGIGTATVGGDLSAQYLDNTTVETRGVLRLKREAINCHITAGRGVDAEHAAIIGGETIVIGPGKLAVLGSDAAVSTTVVLGCVPQMQEQQRQLTSILEKLMKKHQELSDQQATLNARGKLTDPADRERQTELMFELQQADRRIKQATAAQADVAQRIRRRAAIDLSVHKRLYPGVVIQVRDQRYQVNRLLHGPLHIAIRNNQAVVRIGDGETRPLKKMIPRLRD